MEWLKVYLKDALESFERDPADTEYQEGYKAALEEMKRVVYHMNVSFKQRDN